jgi:hypothetical protein
LAVDGPASLAGTLHRFADYPAAAALLEGLAGGERLLKTVRLLFDSGVSAVVAAVKSHDLADALELLREEDAIGAVVCDAADEEDMAALKTHLAACAGDRRERIAFLGAAGKDVAVEMAQELNDERVVLCCPAAVIDVDSDTDALYAAAAMAGAVLSANDPVHNWNGEVLGALSGCTKLPETDIQVLLAAGVTVLEERDGEVSCIRAMTTKTTTAGVADGSLKSLNTILIIDDVMRTVREALTARLRGARVSMETVKAQVTVELAAKQEDGIIESFEVPTVHADGTDPSTCVVEIAFRAAHVLSRIHITAHVSI